MITASIGDRQAIGILTTEPNSIISGLFECAAEGCAWTFVLFRCGCAPGKHDDPEACATRVTESLYDAIAEHRCGAESMRQAPC